MSISFEIRTQKYNQENGLNNNYKEMITSIFSTVYIAEVCGEVQLKNGI